MCERYPCVYFDDHKCKKFSGGGVVSYCIEGPCEHECPSVGDVIRSMNDEELAVLLTDFDFCGDFCWDRHYNINEAHDGCYLDCVKEAMSAFCGGERPLVR